MGAGTPKAVPAVGLVLAPTPTSTADVIGTTPTVRSTRVGAVSSAAGRRGVGARRGGTATRVPVLGSVGTSRAGWSSVTRRCEWLCGTTLSLTTLPCMRCSPNYQKPSRRSLWSRRSLPKRYMSASWYGSCMSLGYTRLVSNRSALSSGSTGRLRTCR